MMMWYLSLLLSLLINNKHCTASSLRRKTQESSSLPNVDVEVTLHPPSGGCSGTQKPILDIYKSSNPSAPTVLHLPGGAYMNLITDTIDTAGLDYINADYTVAVLYYRLPRSSTDKPWLVCSDPNEALHDVAEAMKTLTTNSVEYHVDVSNIVLSGFSAGGHLAALYSSVCEKRGSCPRAQVLHFPFLEKGAKIFCSDVGTAFSNQQDYDTCFPTALVDKGTPPTIVYHATGDTIVPTMEMTNFVTALMNEDISYEYYSVDGGGHYLVPFDQVAAVSDGRLDVNGNYASLIDRALNLPRPVCVRCTDTPSQYMSDNGISCDQESWHIANNCYETPYWYTSGFCRASCYAAGRGYIGEVCCPKKIEDEPSCTECVDVLTPWMINNGQTCASMQASIQTKCRDDNWWTTNKYCQKTCDLAGRGYDGIECCAV